MYYCERKRERSKRGRPGTEASVLDGQKKSYSLCSAALQKQVGCFNHRVITDKLHGETVVVRGLLWC